MLFVGQASIKGDFRKYSKHFNYVELLAEPQQLPNLKKLAALEEQAGASVKFGVVLSPRVWGPEATSLRAYFEKVVKATKPEWVIVRTPTSLRPGPASERQLRERIDDLRPKMGAAKLAWEARGLWEPAMIARVARELDVVPVWDGHSLPKFSLGEGDNYVRFSALGVAGRVNEGRVERLAVQAQDSRALFVVVEGKGALKTKQLLTSLFEDPFAGVEDALDGDSELDLETFEDEASDDDEPSDVDALLDTLDGEADADQGDDGYDVEDDDVEDEEDDGYEGSSSKGNE